MDRNKELAKAVIVRMWSDGNSVESISRWFLRQADLRPLMLEAVQALVQTVVDEWEAEVDEEGEGEGEEEDTD